MTGRVDPTQIEAKVPQPSKKLFLIEESKGSADLQSLANVENHPTINKLKGPSLQVKKSFDQQVKKLIVEAAPNRASHTYLKNLQDQAMRLSKGLAVHRASNENELIPLNRSGHSISNRIKISSENLIKESEPLPIALPHYTSSGRKLHDTSIQAVLSDKLINSKNEMSSSKFLSSRRLSPIRQIRTQAKSRTSTEKLQSSYKPSPSKQTISNNTPILKNTASGVKSKSPHGSLPSISKQPVVTNLIPAQISSNALLASKAKSTSPTGFTTESKSITLNSSKIASRLIAGSSRSVAAASLQISVTKPNARTLKDTAVSSHPSGIAIRSSNMVGASRQNLQNAPESYESAHLGENFSMLKKGSTVSKVEALQADLMERLKKHSAKKIHPITPREIFQAVSSSAKQTKRTMKPPSVQNTSDERSQTDVVRSKEISSQKYGVEVLQPDEDLWKEILTYCDCFDSEVLGEDENPDMKFDFDSFKRSIELDDVTEDVRPKIRSVERSPFERKDRAARAAFAKELEQMEIYEIEKKQRLKPRNLKKELKKEGVYETLQAICHIPDIYEDYPRGNPSRQSIETGMSPPDSHPPTTDEGKFPTPSSSSLEDKIQLRKDNSMVSKTNAPSALTRESAFHEIELSVESDESERTESSTSQTEIISSSSEISLRVNLEKHRSLEGRRRNKVRNAPFLNYQNKILADGSSAEGHKANSKIMDSNLEGIIIDKIASEFGEWAKENGVKPEAVEKDVIKELFQFGTMDTAANSIAVEIKELIIVPETITKGKFPELEERAAMYRQILFDEAAYWRTERYMAFGKPDPKPYKRPPNPPLPAWTHSGFVPQTLATGEHLYKTLIDNDSMMLERYVLWMVENPKHYRPPYLLKSGYFNKIVAKHGGSEAQIRKKSAAMRSLSVQAGKKMESMDYGMQTGLKKLKQMSVVGDTFEVKNSLR